LESSSDEVKSGIINANGTENIILKLPTTKKGNLKPPAPYKAAPTPGPAIPNFVFQINNNLKSLDGL
jgi:hypothetical protein